MPGNSSPPLDPPAGGRTTPPARLGLGDLSIRPGDHIAHFYETRGEWRALLVGWLLEGLKSGDTCVYCMDARGRDWIDLRAALIEAGVDTRGTIESGQLVIREGLSAPGSLKSALDAAMKELRGGRLLRWGGDMSWAREWLPTCGALMQVESSCNTFRDTPVAFLCQYDLTRFPGYVIMDAQRAHPAVVIADRLHASSCFEPPGHFDDLMKRREAERSAPW